MSLPGAHAARRALLAEVGIPDEIVEYIGLTAEFDTERARQALAGSGIEVPPLGSYADKLWDYWERNLDPELAQVPQRQGRRRRQDGADHRRLERHRAGDGAAVRAQPAPRCCWSRAGSSSSRRRGDEIDAVGGTAYIYPADISDPESVDALIERVLAEHPQSTSSSTTPVARSAARSRSPMTASTTSSARCSSTTSARSG